MRAGKYVLFPHALFLPINPDIALKNIHRAYCTALHSTALHCSALYCTTLHFTALHCTSLQHPALLCSVPACTFSCKHRGPPPEWIGTRTGQCSTSGRRGFVRNTWRRGFVSNISIFPNTFETLLSQCQQRDRNSVRKGIQRGGLQPQNLHIFF